MTKTEEQKKQEKENLLSDRQLLLGGVQTILAFKQTDRTVAAMVILESQIKQIDEELKLLREDEKKPPESEDPEGS